MTEQINGTSMTDEQFDALCEANSFGAVARGEYPTVLRGMLKALVDAAVAAEVERLRANRDFWHQACLQAQEHRDGANASNAVWEAETVKLRAEVERLRAALTGLVDFVDGPAEGKRPDVFALLMKAARNALKEPK